MAGMESDTDRLVYLQTLGDTATVDGSDVYGIFENDYIEVLGMESTGPTLMVRAMDVTTATEGISVSIGGVAYTVAEVRAGGDFTFLRLMAAV